MIDITQEYLKARLRYRPETGMFYWINGPRCNKRAGCYSGLNYVQITFGNKKYTGHRLAWLYMYGYMPKEMDHKNRIRNDNRIENLRECTRSQNLANKLPRKRKIDLPRGVHRAIGRNGFQGKYTARITFHGRIISLGTYPSIKQASMAHETKRIELFGDFA